MDQDEWGMRRVVIEVKNRINQVKAPTLKLNPNVLNATFA